jgi:hypothetical protein
MLPEPLLRTSTRTIGRRWRLPVVLVLGLIGCGRRPTAQIVPDSAPARKVLEAAMAAWAAGRPAGMLETKAPRVQVVDSFRKPNQRLEGFEILAETASPRARTFSLRLRLVEPNERPLVRYLVVGIDPILIFRQEDYELLTHFEHKMDPEPPQVGEAPTAAAK